MQRHLPLNMNQLELLNHSVQVVAPSAATWDTFSTQLFPVYDHTILDFLNVFSKELMGAGREWPDLAALGFFIRKNSLQQEIETRKAMSQGCAMPIGMVFHLVPSNVPTVAFYSWIAALLQGNPSIIRLSSKQDPIQNAILTILNRLFSEDEWRGISARTRFIRYEHQDEITAIFSEYCAKRVIWGGDQTIRAIRKIPLSPKAQEQVFPDRKSIAILDTDWLSSLTEVELASLVKKFAADVTQFNQQACASPVIIYWFNKPADQLRQSFWSQLSLQFNDGSVDKYEQRVKTQYWAAVDWYQASEPFGEIQTLQTENIGNYHNLEFGHGVFIEQILQNISELKGQTFQTCVFVGQDINTFYKQFESEPNIRIDRICEAGQALAFNWYWDGFDMLKAFSRNFH